MIPIAVLNLLLINGCKNKDYSFWEQVSYNISNRGNQKA